MTHRATALRVLPLAVLALGTAPLSAQVAELVRDINVTAGPSGPFAPSSDPMSFFPWQGRLFFAATQQGSGREPWVTDGTASGTQLLADVCQGDCWSSPQFFGGMGNAVLFGALPDVPGFEGQQLWRSDGTRAGTFALTDLTVQLADQVSAPQLPTAIAGGRIFFTGCPVVPADGCRLWVSDGTAGGTRQVPGLDGAQPQGAPVAAGGKAYVIAQGGDGYRVWATDGTAAGTAPLGGMTQANFVSSLVAGTDRVFFQVNGDQIWTVGVAETQAHLVPLPSALGLGPSLAAVGHHAYFVGSDSSEVSQLWVTDGTQAGTGPLTAFTKDQAPQFGFTGAPTVVELGDHAIFVVDLAPGLAPQLWVSSGSPATSVKLANTTLVSPLVVGNRVLYTAIAQEGTSVTLWSTDGTPSGSHLLARGLCPGECGGAIEGVTLAGGNAFFAADAGQGFQLWRSDGTPGGTRAFTDVANDEPNLDPSLLAVLGGELFFSASGPYGQELWKSDGAPGGTLLVTDIARNESSSNPAGLAAFAGQLLFSAFDGTSRQLWRSAGTDVDTSALTAFGGQAPGFDDRTGEPQQLVAAGGTMFFWRQGDGTTPYHLWRTDGTAAGTLLLHDFDTLGDQHQGPPPPPAPLGSRIFFSVPGDGGGTALWSSDGTQGGTQPAVELTDLSSPLENLTAVGGRLFFAAAAGPSEQYQGRLYVSDGTPAGTTVVLAGAFDVTAAMQFTAAGSTVFFVLTRDRAARELWTTDGTVAGTSFVTSLFVGEGFDPQPSDLTAFGGALYFFTSTATGRGLYRSDGSRTGLVQLHSFTADAADPGTTPSHSLTVFGDRLCFVADDGVHGRELWTSDGTAAGTSMLLDIYPGPLSSGPSWLTVAGGRLWFSADDGVHGIELWRTDGTAAGTGLVQDIASGPDSSYPDQLTAAGNLLYFTADDGASGRELWALPLSPTGSGCQPTSTRLCLAGNRFQVQVAWRDHQGNPGVGMAVPLTADTGYFWFFGAGDVELIVKVLDGRALNQSFWVFYGALSDVEYTITVTDTATGLTRQYFNPSGQLASVGDTSAFGPLGELSAPPTAEARGSRTAAPALVAARIAPARPTPAAATGARAAPSGTPCRPGPTRLCLLGSRFAVEAAWQDFQGRTGTGTAVPLGADTGYYWFFGPGNVEVVLKVIDGRAVDGKFWVFYGALSSVQYTLTVTDTLTGRVRTYQNQAGQLASVADTAAF
jgi:ELWxxDGT repeat protein